MSGRGYLSGSELRQSRSRSAEHRPEKHADPYRKTKDPEANASGSFAACGKSREPLRRSGSCFAKHDNKSHFLNPIATTQDHDGNTIAHEFYFVKRCGQIFSKIFWKRGEEGHPAIPPRARRRSGTARAPRGRECKKTFRSHRDGNGRCPCSRGRMKCGCSGSARACAPA